MVTVGAEKLKGNETRREYRCFQPWLDHAALLAERFYRECDDDPFAYNETASVSLLCSAAIASGQLALAEFAQEKRGLGRGRPYVGGRWDMWMGSDRFQWGLEFKQIKTRFMPDRLEQGLAAAWSCARAIERTHADQRLGCLIASPRGEGAVYHRALANLEAFAEGCDYAWRIDAGDGHCRTFLFFRTV